MYMKPQIFQNCSGKPKIYKPSHKRFKFFISKLRYQFGLPPHSTFQKEIPAYFLKMKESMTIYEW
jgi:uncharacterized protein (DUF1786 family)